MSTGSERDQTGAAPPVPAASSTLAEGAWTGPAPAAEMLEQARLGAAPSPAGRHGFFFRELSVPQATLLLASAFFVSAMLGAVRQALFNAEFGAGRDASAYYAAFRLPDALFVLIAGGALSAAMIPVLISTGRAEGEAARLRLIRVVLTMLLLAFVGLTLAGELLARPFVTFVLAPGFDRPTTDLAVKLTRIMLLQPMILAAGSVALAVLNSRSRFILTAISILSHNVTLILGITATRIHPELGIYGPTFGVVAGAVLQVAIVLPGLLEGRAAALRPRWAPRDMHLREVVRLLIPNGLSVGVGYAGFIVDTSFASTAREPEALAAILNAWLLVGLPITLFGVALGQASFPQMAAHAASGDLRRLRRTVGLSLIFAFAAAIPAAALLFLGGRAAIRTVFEHGEFDAVAASLTGDLLVVYAIALPAYVATEVLTRALIALRDTRTPLLTNSLQLVGRALVIWLLLDSEGAVAIPIAFAITATAETCLLGLVLARKLRGSTAPASPPARARSRPRAGLHRS